MDTVKINHDLTGFAGDQHRGEGLHSSIQLVTVKPGLDQVRTSGEYLETLDPARKALLLKKREQSKRIMQNALEGNIIEIPVLMYQGENPFIVLNGIHTVFANPKQGKSVLLNTIVANALTAPSRSPDLLDIRTNEAYKDKLKVIIFDTEQGEIKTTQRTQIINKSIGFTKDNPPPPGLIEMISLRNETNKDRLFLLEDTLKDYSVNYPDSYFLVILDTITDFTVNFNDLDETVLFWEKLLSLSETLKATFINTMHKSKNGSSLGHMGTFAEKKSEVIFDLVKRRSPKGKGSPPTYELYTKDTRNFADSDEPLRMKYNTETDLYRLVNEEERTEIREAESDTAIIKQLFESVQFSSFTVTIQGERKGNKETINPGLIEIFGDLQKDTITRRLNKLCDSNPVKTDSNLLKIQLHKTKIGKKTAFVFKESLFENEVSEEQKEEGTGE